MSIEFDALSPAGAFGQLSDGDSQFAETQGCEPAQPFGRTTRAEILPGDWIFHERELQEHRSAISDVLRRLIDPVTGSVTLPLLPFDFSSVSRVTIAACGSAFHAGLIGRSWFESLARLPADAEMASEFSYRDLPLPPGGAGLVISDSSDSADTLAAARAMQAWGQRVLSIVDGQESSVARESDAVLTLMARSATGTAGTTAFSSQLTVLACLALEAARARRAVTPERQSALIAALQELPDRALELLDSREALGHAAGLIAEARSVLFLGRGTCHPVALEGALKLKQLSEIHGEGYAAGEMKHGPIALIDCHVPVMGLAPSGPLFEKTASNLQEARARSAQLVIFSDAHAAARLRGIANQTVVLPAVEPIIAPILYGIAMHLLAYHVAVLKGADVDQPLHPANHPVRNIRAA